MHPDKAKETSRKHVTTACVSCRESKIRCDGAIPSCQNCRKKGKNCKYQHGNDKRKVSLRTATELFATRIDQLCEFIYDHGLEPPSMNPEDEFGLSRILDTLQVPHGSAARKKKMEDLVVFDDTVSKSTPVEGGGGDDGGASTSPLRGESPRTKNDGTVDVSSLGVNADASVGLSDGAERHLLGTMPGVVDNSTSSANNHSDDISTNTNWGFALPTAESLDAIYANFEGGSNWPTVVDNQNLQQQPGPPVLGQSRDERNTTNKDPDSDEEEEDEADNYVIEQLSHRIGTLKLAGDGHLRFYGATSNLNLVDVSATQQRQHPEARTVRQDGQDILSHLGIGQYVDQGLEDHLAELYFTWQNPSAYVVDKEMYITARSKWRNEHDDTPFYSEVLTNAMCAVGSAFEARYHPTFITFPKSLAEFFADRAKALLEIELDSPCVATVQALIILSWHEGASNRDARGWLYSGMSMRLAFDLGLHVDMTPYVEKGDLSPFEASVRQAAFWGSYSADHFWGFYLGRPFRMNTGDITVPKPASSLGPEREATWRPYGLDTQSAAFSKGLRSSNELISRQFAILWEIVSPVSHILYGCTDISRHELQRVTHGVTEKLFSWKANLPSNLEIDLDMETTPKPPHLLMLHMQYHQIVIFFHRPWVSKNYIQPRYPRQGPGYLHARRMCIESAIAIAKLLQFYENYYTFSRMNNQVVAIIFTAALILIFVTILNSPISPRAGPGIGDINADKVAHLNLCFRALDELGRSFENAKRTRDFLISLQRRWQAHMRRSGSGSASGSMKRRQAIDLDTHQHQNQRQTSGRPVRHYTTTESDAASRKKSKLGSTPAQNSPNPTTTTTSSIYHTKPVATSTSLPPPPSSSSVSDGLDMSFHSHYHPPLLLDQPQPQQQQQTPVTQHEDLDWVPASSDFRFLSSGNLRDCEFASQMMDVTDGSGGNASSFFGEESGLPSFSDIEAWWGSPDATSFPSGEDRSI